MTCFNGRQILNQLYDKSGTYLTYDRVFSANSDFWSPRQRNTTTHHDDGRKQLKYIYLLPIWASAAAAERLLIFFHGNVTGRKNLAEKKFLGNGDDDNETVPNKL